MDGIFLYSCYLLNVLPIFMSLGIRVLANIWKSRLLFFIYRPDETHNDPIDSFSELPFE